MAYIRDMRSMTSLPSVFDDSSSMKTEEAICMESAQKFGSGQLIIYVVYYFFIQANNKKNIFVLGVTKVLSEAV